MDFSSDTAAPAHPAVVEALARVNHGTASSYGNDAVTADLRMALSRVLETDDFDFWLCASGTASNALALSCFCPPTGAVLCHAGAHIAVDERGAPEFFSGGGKLQLLGGPQGQISEDELRSALSRINHDFVHETPAHVLSLTNLTECGLAYTPEEIARFAKRAKGGSLAVHLDGARLANALVHGSAAGRVFVRAVIENGRLSLSVNNQGEPIASDRLAQLFKPYWREASSTQSGLGLGLYIANEIAASHGGSMQVTSTAEAGTTFTFSMPTGAALV